MNIVLGVVLWVMVVVFSRLRVMVRRMCFMRMFCGSWGVLYLVGIVVYVVCFEFIFW